MLDQCSLEATTGTSDLTPGCSSEVGGPQEWAGPCLVCWQDVCRARRLSPEATAGESRGGGHGCSPELGHLSAEDLSFISTHSQRSANLSVCWWLYRILWGVGVVWSHS